MASGGMIHVSEEVEKRGRCLVTRLERAVPSFAGQSAPIHDDLCPEWAGTNKENIVLFARMPTSIAETVPSARAGSRPFPYQLYRQVPAALMVSV